MEKYLASEVDAALSQIDDKYDVDYPALFDNSSKDDLVKSLYKVGKIQIVCIYFNLLLRNSTVWEYTRKSVTLTIEKT